MWWNRRCPGDRFETAFLKRETLDTKSRLSLSSLIRSMFVLHASQNASARVDMTCRNQTYGAVMFVASRTSGCAIANWPTIGLCFTMEEVGYKMYQTGSLRELTVRDATLHEAFLKLVESLND